MTCDTVLETLLDAEPSALLPDDSTPLGAHLRACAKCRRLSAQLMADTRLLATGVAQVNERVRSRRVRRLMLAPSLAVAAIVVLTVWRGYPGDVRSIAPVVVTNAPPPTVAKGVGEVVARAESAPHVARAPSLVRVFPRPSPVAPVRFERAESRATSEVIVSSPAVTIDPPPGVRAAVLRTSDPKLVVVWLY